MSRATPRSARARSAQSPISDDTSGAGRDRSQPATRFDRWIGPAVFLVAVAIRLPHIGWGLPSVEEEALPMRKAFDMWGWLEGKLALDPKTAGWPSLSFYIALMVQKLHYAVGRVLGVFHDRYDYYVDYLIDPSQVVVVTRLVSVLACGLACVVAYRIGRRLAGRWGGMMAALMLAFSPMLVTYGQEITPDILVALFAALALERLLDIYDHGRVRDYLWAAVWIALGAGSKYTPVLLVVVLYVAHLLRLRGERKSLLLLGLNDKRLGYAALACALVFCATSPYLLAHFSIVKRDFAYQGEHLTRGHFGHESQTASGHWYYLSAVLPSAVGLPALLLGAWGMGWAALRRRGAWALIAMSALVFFGVLGFFSTRFDRYMLPVLLPLALGVVALQRELAGIAVERVALRRAIGPAIAVAAVVPAALMSLHVLSVRGGSSTARLASDFVVRQLPPDHNTYVAEMYSVQLPSTEVIERMEQSDIFQKLSPAQQARVRAQRAFQYTYIPMYSTRVELSAFYYDLRYFAAYDYVITSGAVRGRYLAAPERYPQQTQFYQDLDTYCELVRKFSPGKRTPGPEIRIYRVTDAGMNKLVAARGALQSDWYEAYLDRLHAPHFVDFCQSVAADAYARKRYDISELFYGALLATSDSSERLRWVFSLAYSKMQQGKLNESVPLLKEHLAANPDDKPALADLGLVYEQLGDIAQARLLYQRCVELDPDGKMGDWARKRMAELQAP